MKYIIKNKNKKKQVEITTKYYHMSPSYNDVWINTEHKTKNHHRVDSQQGEPLFWLWWDTEENINLSFQRNTIYSITMGTRSLGGRMASMFDK